MIVITYKGGHIKRSHIIHYRVFGASVSGKTEIYVVDIIFAADNVLVVTASVAAVVVVAAAASVVVVVVSFALFVLQEQRSPAAMINAVNLFFIILPHFLHFLSVVL